MYLCICKSVTDRQISEAVELGARTMGDLSIRLGVGMDCSKCLDSARECLEAALAARRAAATQLPAGAASSDPSPPAAQPVPASAPAPAAWFAVDL